MRPNSYLIMLSLLNSSEIRAEAEDGADPNWRLRQNIWAPDGSVSATLTLPMTKGWNAE